MKLLLEDFEYSLGTSTNERETLNACEVALTLVEALEHVQDSVRAVGAQQCSRRVLLSEVLANLSIHPMPRT